MALASPNFISLRTELVQAFLVGFDKPVQGFPIQVNPLLPTTGYKEFNFKPTFKGEFQPDNPGFMAKNQGEEFPGGPD